MDTPPGYRSNRYIVIKPLRNFPEGFCVGRSTQRSFRFVLLDILESVKQNVSSSTDTIPVYPHQVIIPLFLAHSDEQILYLRMSVC